MNGKLGLLLFTVLTVVIAATALTLVNTSDAKKALLSESNTATIKTSKDVTAIVEVIFEPPLCNGGSLRFNGVPSGEITLDNCVPVAGQPLPRRLLTATSLAPGIKESTLGYIDPTIAQLGYRLFAILCDDGESESVSTGNIVTRMATFRTEVGETVTCKYVLALVPPPEPVETPESETEETCACPKEGRWKVKNNEGQMACSGTFSIYRKLKPNTDSSTIKTQDDCGTIVAEGMSGTDAALTVRRIPRCAYKGTVGGGQDGIPMNIDFTVRVVNATRMTGVLTSKVTEQGTTCNMTRSFELDYDDKP